jgi:hypothetical protein
MGARRRDSRNLVVSLELLRRSAEDRRVEQARLVSAWLVEMREESDGWMLSYLVRNNSEEPCTT